MTRTALRLLAAVAALALLAPATAVHANDGYDIRAGVAAVGDPRPDVRFEGAGWGHGIGMSQYGAYARAREGHTAHQILTSYFPGTTLPERDTNRPIRVGLRQGVNCADVRATAGAVQWHITDGGSTQTVTQPQGETWYVNALASGTRIQDAPCGESDYEGIGSYGHDVVIDVRHDGTRIDTSDAGGQFTRGTHRIHRVSSGLTTVQHLGSVETYLRGIAEVPDSWGNHQGMAALQAQAIAARGFALRRLSNPRSPQGGCFCDLLNSTSDQVYRGVDHGPNWVEAVRSTARKVLVDGNGSVAQTFYSSSNGGRSENNEDVWGGSAVGYLRSIQDPYSLDGVNPYRSWTATADNRSVAEALGSSLRSVEQLTIQGRTAGGTPREVVFRGRDGNGREVSGTLRNSNGVGAGVTLRSRLSSGVDVVRGDGSPGVRALPSSQVSRIGFEPFRDDDGGPHEYATVWAYEAGITEGFGDGTFRPGNSVTRGQMASFIYRTFDVPASSSDNFRDVDPRGPHGAAINALADAGIAQGYDDDTFRAGSSVTRAQMASFLVRAIGLDGVAPDGRFRDVSSGPHAANIHAIAEEGITQGCRQGAYCPQDSVRRGQMATFLHRTVEGG